MSLEEAQTVLNWVLNRGVVPDRGEHAIAPFSLPGKFSMPV